MDDMQRWSPMGQVSLPNREHGLHAMERSTAIEVGDPAGRHQKPSMDVVGPNNPTTGSPNAEQRCSNPVSPATASCPLRIAAKVLPKPLSATAVAWGPIDSAMRSIGCFSSGPPSRVTGPDQRLPRSTQCLAGHCFVAQRLPGHSNSVAGGSVVSLDPSIHGAGAGPTPAALA